MRVARDPGHILLGGNLCCHGWVLYEFTVKNLRCSTGTCIGTWPCCLGIQHGMQANAGVKNFYNLAMFRMSKLFDGIRSRVAGKSICEKAL